MAAVMSSPLEAQVAVSATKLLINGQWTNSESGKTFPTINPATGKEICQVAEADAADVNKAVKGHGRPSIKVHGARCRAQSAGGCSTSWPI